MEIIVTLFDAETYRIVSKVLHFLHFVFIEVGYTEAEEPC